MIETKEQFTERMKLEFVFLIGRLYHSLSELKWGGLLKECSLELIIDFLQEFQDMLKTSQREASELEDLIKQRMLKYQNTEEGGNDKK
ncbi:MAG: hypothetical protein JHC30_06240 [Caldisericum sp.]|jgi:hypothetical protein|nr:hypothetical protein [Caldisericum sp.]